MLGIINKHETVKPFIFSTALLSLTGFPLIGAAGAPGSLENPSEWHSELRQLESHSQGLSQPPSQYHPLALDYQLSYTLDSTFQIDPISDQAPQMFRFIKFDKRKPIRKFKDKFKLKMLNSKTKFGKTQLYFDSLKQEMVGKARYGRTRYELRFNDNRAKAKFRFYFD